MTPPSTEPCHVIICEATGHWATAARRSAPAGLTIAETRTIDELRRQLDQAPRAIAVLELAKESTDDTVRAISELSDNYPSSLVLVVADRSLVAWHGLCREAGATHFIASPRQIGDIVGIIQRRKAVSRT